jgi:REP element-mobilizing transposase RayT
MAKLSGRKNPFWFVCLFMGFHARGMANNYSQIYIQIVFAPEGRQSLIPKKHKEELHKYMTGIVTERRQKLLAVHCMPDHTHMLIGLKPSMALSDLVRDVKNASANFINRKRWVIGRFSWQEGFGAFSYGHSQLSGIINYIRDQERRHAKRTFREEYLRFLKKYEIEHDERFIFQTGGVGRSVGERRETRGPLPNIN